MECLPQVEEIKNVRDGFVADMRALLQRGKEHIQQLTQTKAELVDVENELFVRKEAIKTDIRRAVQNLLRNMNEQEVGKIGAG